MRGMLNYTTTPALFISPIASINESVEEFLIVTPGWLITSLRLARLHVLQTTNLLLSSPFVSHLMFLRHHARGTASATSTRFHRHVYTRRSRNQIVKCLVSLRICGLRHHLAVKKMLNRSQQCSSIEKNFSYYIWRDLALSSVRCSLFASI